MSFTGEPIKPYDCSVAIRSQLHLLLFIRDRLLHSPKRLRMFEETVFAPWIYIKDKEHDNHLLNYILHHQRYDESPSIEAPILFDIGDHTLQLGRHEFCLLTGFTCGKVVFDELKKDGIPPFVRRVFPEKVGEKGNRSTNKGVSYNVKGCDLELLVKDEKRWEKLSDEDAVRVCLLLMEESIFMGQRSRIVVKNSMMMLVEDIPAWNRFPWGEYFWREFHKRVVNLVPNHKESHMKKLKKDPHYTPAYSICGFAWVLKVWILESFPNSDRWWVKDRGLIPRCLAWRRNIQFEKKHYSQLFGTDSNPKTFLAPTIEEMKQEWWGKSHDYFDNYSQFAQVANLGRNVERVEEGEAVGRDGGGEAKTVNSYLGRAIPSTIYTRTLECSEGPANILQTETHCQHGTWDTVNLQGINTEKEIIALSSSDVSPMPSKLITKVMYDDGNEEFIDLKMKQWELPENVSATFDSAPPTKVSTPESDEDVWCPKDTKNFQGAATVYDCRNKRLKLSCDHGEEGLLDLNGRWELVENVSPTQDRMEQDMPKKLTSPEFGTVSVQGYKVKIVNAPILEAIFKNYGDIAADCVFKIASVRDPILEVVCDVVRKIQTNDDPTIISEMAEIENLVSAAEANKIKVSWLRAHLESIHKRNNVKKNCSLLMKTKASTILVTMAARRDLKSAKERFEKAERCVKVLNLVEKKLHDNFLESKAEKDSWAKQSIFFAN